MMHCCGANAVAGGAAIKERDSPFASGTLSGSAGAPPAGGGQFCDGHVQLLFPVSLAKSRQCSIVRIMVPDPMPSNPRRGSWRCWPGRPIAALTANRGRIGGQAHSLRGALFQRGERLRPHPGERPRPRLLRHPGDCIYPVNDNFMELLFWIDALKRASAQQVTAVIPFFSYAKGDKKDEPRVSIRARVCADAIEAAGADRVLTMDLHSPQIQGFFRHSGRSPVRAVRVVRPHSHARHPRPGRVQPGHRVSPKTPRRTQVPRAAGRHRQQDPPRSRRARRGAGGHRRRRRTRTC